MIGARCAKGHGNQGQGVVGLSAQQTRMQSEAMLEQFQNLILSEILRQLSK